MADDFGLKIGLEGEKEFKKALADINQSFKVLGSEMKVVQSQFDQNDSSVEALTARNQVLNKEIDAQRQKIDTLRSALKNASESFGENDRRTQNWQIQLNNATAALNGMERELEQNNDALAKAENGFDDAGKEADDFGDELKEAGNDADSSGGKFEKLGSVVKGVAVAMGAALAAIGTASVAAGKALVDMTVEAAAYADEMITQSTVTGMSVESLQAYAYAADLVDVSLDTLTGSMAKNVKSMSNAAQGSAKYAEAYEKLGVSVTNADGSLRNSEEVYWEVIDALGRVSNETERDAIAMQLFGKSAQELNPLIAQGSEGIAALTEEAKRMGAVLSEETIEKLGAFDDSVQRLKQGSEAAKRVMGTVLLPQLQTLADDGVALLGEFTSGLAEAGTDFEKMERIVERVDFGIPAQPKALQVCAYARVSSGKDAMLHSLSAQVSYYSDLIQNHSGWLYCGVYSDEAMTGTKSQRDNFQRMIEDCRQGKIDLIITKSISRFARNTVTLLQTVRELKSLGIDVYFEEQHIHTMSSDGELMMTILASYAQEESLSASENQKWRVRKGFENGELINLRFLFGYDITAEGIKVNEKEAAIVREIFARFNSGESMGSIGRDLDVRGYRGALGGTWRPERMRNTLSNEKYLGNALLQKSYRNNHIEKKQVPNKGELPMYYAEGTHEPIIDSVTFEQAQERLRKLEQQAAKRKKPTRSAFSGLIQCGSCGNTYKRITYRGKHFWNCTTFQTKGKSECAAKKIPEETLEALTCEVLGTDSLDPKAVKDRITTIRVEKNNVVVFCLEDGSEIVKQWKDRSRAESWTPEMREQARQRTLQVRRQTG